MYLFKKVGYPNFWTWNWSPNAANIVVVVVVFVVVVDVVVVVRGRRSLKKRGSVNSDRHLIAIKFYTAIIKDIPRGLTELDFLFLILKEFTSD